MINISTLGGTNSLVYNPEELFLKSMLILNMKIIYLLLLIQLNNILLKLYKLNRYLPLKK